MFLSHFINDIRLFICHLFVYRFLIRAVLVLHKDELLTAVLHLLNSSLMLFWNACWTLPLNFQDMHITTATKGQSINMTSFNSFNHYAWCLQSFNIYKSQGQRRSLTVYFFPKCTDCFFTFVSRMLFFTVGSVGYLGFVNWFFTDPVLFTKCCFSSDFSKFLHIVLNTLILLLITEKMMHHYYFKKGCRSSIKYHISACLHSKYWLLYLSSEVSLV